MDVSVIFKGPELYLALTTMFYFLGEKVYPRIAKLIDWINQLIAQYIIPASPAIRYVDIGLRTTCTEARLFSGTSMCKESNPKDPQHRLRENNDKTKHRHAHVGVGSYAFK